MRRLGCSVPMNNGMLSMLGRIREWHKLFFCIDLTCELTRLVVVVVVGLAAATLALAHQEFGQALPALGRVLGAIALLGVAAWVYHDAPKAVRTIRQQRQEQTDAHTDE